LVWAMVVEMVVAAVESEERTARRTVSVEVGAVGVPLGEDGQFERLAVECRVAGRE